MEISVQNKGMSVFFKLIPKVYYVLPWRFRLIPNELLVQQDQDEEDKEREEKSDDKEEVRREIELQEG